MVTLLLVAGVSLSTLMKMADTVKAFPWHCSRDALEGAPEEKLAKMVQFKRTHFASEGDIDNCRLSLLFGTCGVFITKRVRGALKSLQTLSAISNPTKSLNHACKFDLLFMYKSNVVYLRPTSDCHCYCWYEIFVDLSRVEVLSAFHLIDYFVHVIPVVVHTRLIFVAVVVAVLEGVDWCSDYNDPDVSSYTFGPFLPATLKMMPMMLETLALQYYWVSNWISFVYSE